LIVSHVREVHFFLLSSCHWTRLWHQGNFG